MLIGHAVFLGWAFFLVQPESPAHAIDETPCRSTPAVYCGKGVIARGRVAAREAKRMIGTPYSWGGGGPDGPSYGIGKGSKTFGFDCSGLSEYAWAKAGVLIGSTTYEQWRSGREVPRHRIRLGDLVFFDTKPKIVGPDHVGIAVSPTHMVVAPYTGTLVRVEAIERGSFMTVIRPGARIRKQ